jgi:predicted dehydrogenase
MKRKTTRREFLSAGTLVTAGSVIVASGILKAGDAPNEKLNIAVIGVAGRGGADLGEVASENIVALCDVNENNLAGAAKRFEKAQKYSDWRKCLEQKDIDAVVCATTDHTHAFVNTWALNRGKHVYCEKPIANSVHEARTVREAYLKNKKLSTQQGTQIHATDNYRRVVELVRHGAIGTPQEVQVWCSRAPAGGSYLPAAGDPPAHLNWDLWSGPSYVHPYNPGYMGGCLAWNRFWDFGSGQIGDMGSHMLDLAYWAFDLRFPTSCVAQGSPLSTDTCPTWLTCEWDHPANDWRPAVKVYWYDGGKKPGVPSAQVFNRDAMFKGLIFKGDKGWLVADYDYRVLMMKGDMTHYKAPKPEEIIPPSIGHHKEWIQGAKTGKTPLCNFDYAGALIEHNLLPLVSYRLGDVRKTKVKDPASKKKDAAEKEEDVTFGKKLEWDAANLKATNCPEAEKYIKKTYREGWTLNG